MGQLTVLLNRIHAGDSTARDALFAAAYAELHRLAQARLRAGGRNAVLDTTCLVHESYLRFVDAGELGSEDRQAFFAYASRVMRSVIVDTIRDRLAKKRGGDWMRLTLSTEKADPRLAEVAQMRYFGGYSGEEIADTLGVSERTVQRDWDKARLILAAALR
jgi:RNA polymerase sigma factor (TIGR02999 family)